MILVNRAIGIGTGFSSTVLQYNPKDLIQCIKAKLADETPARNLMPFYRGFTGRIEEDSTNKYTTYAVWSFDDRKRCLHNTELPINVWTDNYKSMCEKMLVEDNSPLVDVQYGNTDVVVDFKLIIKPAEYPTYKAMSQNELIKKFQLSSKLSATNMYLFDAEGKINKYSDIYSIIDYYFVRRFELYVKRRQIQSEQLRYDILILRNKAAFIQAVKQGKIDQRRMTEVLLLRALQSKFAADPSASG